MELMPIQEADIAFFFDPMATNTQLFSFLALLSAYVPESYLLMSECQQILGPPDPIHEVPFEERVRPFSFLIQRSGRNPEHVCIIHPLLAQHFVTLLAKLGMSRTATVKRLMFSLCGDLPQPHVLQFIKYLLTKRTSGEKGRDKFSRLIEDILGEGSFYNAVSVLKTASNKLIQSSIYPQTLSRLYYVRGGVDHYEKAEKWAKTAIERAENNSYVADTLGQVYKNWMRKAKQPNDIQQMANKAFNAFKEVERKADNEEGPEMSDMAVSISDSFNDRGLFGFIQVAKMAFEKLRALRSPLLQEQVSQLQMEVQAKFDFFERYLTYSKPTATSAEPHYFWKDIALCYEMYTTASAAESTSFPGLLDGLSRGLFTSKGRRAGFKEAEITASDLEEIRVDLKTSYEADPDDVQAAESYILSNITLSNKIRRHCTPVNELRAIMHRFMHTDVGRRSPEFYLLALLLFWPEEAPQVVQGEGDEDVEQPASEDDTLEVEDEDVEQPASEDETLEVEDEDGEQPASEDETLEVEDEDGEQPASEDETLEVEDEDGEQPASEDETLEVEDEDVEQPASEDETLEVEDDDGEHGTSREPEQPSLDFMFDPQRYVAFMETSFERSDAKHLRGRYLSPLFFLGQGSGLSRWIHKSRLDEIVGREVDAELAGEQNESTKEKWKRINKKWTTGDVWRIPEVEEMLLPVRVEPRGAPTTPSVEEEEEVLVCAGRKRIRVTKEAGPVSGPSPVRFYLGFNIKGPVVFNACGQ